MAQFAFVPEVQEHFYAVWFYTAFLVMVLLLAWRKACLRRGSHKSS